MQQEAWGHFIRTLKILNTLSRNSSEIDPQLLADLSEAVNRFAASAAEADPKTPRLAYWLLHNLDSVEIENGQHPKIQNTRLVLTELCDGLKLLPQEPSDGALRNAIHHVLTPRLARNTFSFSTFIFVLKRYIEDHPKLLSPEDQSSLNGLFEQTSRTRIENDSILKDRQKAIMLMLVHLAGANPDSIDYKDAGIEEPLEFTSLPNARSRALAYAVRHALDPEAKPCLAKVVLAIAPQFIKQDRHSAHLFSNEDPDVPFPATVNKLLRETSNTPSTAYRFEPITRQATAAQNGNSHDPVYREDTRLALMQMLMFFGHANPQFITPPPVPSTPQTLGTHTQQEEKSRAATQGSRVSKA